MDVPAYGQDRVQRIQRERVQSRWSAAYAPARHLDPVLVFSALVLTAVGMVVIYSAKLQALTVQGLPPTTFVTRQAVALLVGVVALGLVAAFDYRHLRGYAAVVYLGAVVLLVLTITPLGTEINGSQRWLILAGFQLQPSEVAKVAVLVSLAALLHERKGEPGLPTVGISLVLVGVPMALVFLQPDLGTSIVFVWIAAVLLLVGGVKARYLVGLVIAGVMGVVAALRLELIQSYQVQRLTGFLDAGDPSLAQGPVFQTRQSLIAIGSGQFFGKGLFEGTQTSLSYVPENHTDFIFTVVGEEFGFVGAVAVLVLFLVVIWRGLRIAVLSKDLFGTLLAAGVVGIFTLQVFLNVGMTVGIMPVTGIPLPFVSYGGTSLIVWLAMVGLLLNIHMRRF
jgi:rod shape determining protein RodA